MRRNTDGDDEAAQALVSHKSHGSKSHITGSHARLGTAGTSPAIPPPTQPSKPVAWKDMPRKKQLMIITLSRMSEPLVQSSLQAYMFYQLKWFDPSLSDSTISAQAGVLQASLTAAQFLTALFWGRVADNKRFGRKSVLLIGLTGTALSCLGFGFSTTFWQALVFRTLGGATNGNIGVMRTMISEIIREKKYQARAFVLLPMTFNIGVIIGPILGGLLSDPAGSYPDLFGKVSFFVKFPYVLPNIVSTIFLIAAALAVWFGIEETHEALRDRTPDLGSRIGQRIAQAVWRRGSRPVGTAYSSIPADEIELTDEESCPPPKKKKRYTQQLPFRRIFTRNVTMTFISYFLMAFHIGTINSLWFVFLSTPVANPKTPGSETHLPFQFTGGLGLQPQSVGFAMAILGVIGITMQLFLYPRISHRLGTTLASRLSLLCFPVAYFLMPYLSVVPSTSAPPESKTGAAIWIAICGLLMIQVTGRTFALPCQAILVNNCSPHPSVLGTVHGLGLSVSSAARTIGPMIAGVVYGYGLDHGVIGMAFWALSGISVIGCFTSLLVHEGDGHEIWLEGDEEPEMTETER